MNKDVLITISGTQLEYADVEGDANETIEIVNPATYFFKDGLHYIFFEEVYEGSTSITKNKIVFKEDEYLEVVKKGAMNSNMCFHRNEYHESSYETPYGQMQLGVKTLNLHSVIEEETMLIQATYELVVNCESYAECEIILKVKNKLHGI